MTNWVIKFKNDAGQEVWETPFEEINGQRFMFDARGFRQSYEGKYNHPTLGHLIWSRTEPIAEKPPKPPDHEHNSAVAEFLSVLNGSFPSNEMRIRFETEHDDIVLAMNTGFEGVSLDQLAAWKALIREATTAPEFNRYELTEKFKSPQCGDLRINDLVEYATKENGWDPTWAASCYNCGTKLVNIKASTILKMRRDGKTFRCGKPCKAHGGR